MDDLNDVFNKFFKKVKRKSIQHDSLEFTKLLNSQLLLDLQNNIRSYAKVCSFLTNL